MPEKFLAWLEKRGQCRAYVDPFGEVIVYRYFLFGTEPDESAVEKGDARPRFWPNVWLHKLPFSEYGPDGGNYHVHPWATVSIILRGGYEEFLEGKESRWRGAGCFVFRSAKQPHYIGQTKPGTLTVFLHGFRRHAWHFRLGACKGLCGFCEAEGATQCLKTGRTVAYNDYHRKIGPGKVPKWMPWNAHTRALAARRRRLVARGGAERPTFGELETLIQQKSRRVLEETIAEDVAE